MGSNLRQPAARPMKWLKKYIGGSGQQFDSKKLQLSEEPTILGVTYDLKGDVPEDSRVPGKRSCRTRSIRSSVHLCSLQVRLGS